MMKHIFTAYFLVVTFFTAAQATKSVTVKHENPWYTEKYMVLKSNSAIKHGDYKQLGYKNCLMLNGYYQNNKKDSIWTEYFWRSKVIKSQGEYKDDQKNGLWMNYFLNDNKNTIRSKGHYDLGKQIGIWEFYDKKGELIQRFNYDTREVLFFKKDTTLIYDVKTENGIEKMQLDRPPMYVGDTFEASAALAKLDLRYPQDAVENEISGTVLISFFVDENGRAIDHAIHEGIGGGCDEEALRVVKLIEDNWVPAQLNGKAVTAKYIFKVKFSLNLVD